MRPIDGIGLTFSGRIIYEDGVYKVIVSALISENKIISYKSFEDALLYVYYRKYNMLNELPK